MAVYVDIQEEKKLVSQCANPNCQEPFLYLRSGKLFAVPRRNGPPSQATIECFWLCQSCAESLIFEFAQDDQHPTLVSRHLFGGSAHQIECKL
jgi:hypothetical protein